MRIAVLDAETLGFEAEAWSSLAELGDLWDLELHAFTEHRKA